MTMIAHTTDTVESEKATDVRPCTDPFCVHDAHDWADEDWDFEHDSALKLVGKGYEITLHRDIIWSPLNGTPEGWYVEPYVTDAYMGPDAVTQLTADLAEARKACIAANIALARQERLAHFPIDEMITTEVEVMIRDREWSHREAATRFGMTEAALKSRLNGYSSWTVRDVGAAAEALVGTEWPERVSQWIASAEQHFGSARR